MRSWRRKYGLAVVVAVIVVALLLFGMEARKALRTRKAVDAVVRLGGSAYRSDVCFEDGMLRPGPPGWLTRCAQLLGADCFRDVVHVSFKGMGRSVADGDLAILVEFPNLLDLDLCDAAIGDGGLKHLVGLTKLCNLDLRRTRVTDAGLAHLAQLENLKFLDVDGTHVTRSGIERLKRAIPDVKTIPMFCKQMADWYDLEEEMEKFLKDRRSANR
jgi:hypothetical protein